MAVLALFAVVFTTSCKKDDKTPKELLTDVSCWKPVKEETKATATDPWTGGAPEACTADDCVTFGTDGSYKTDEGASKCDPTDPQTSAGTFTLSEDGKTLTITEDGLTLPFTVEELTESKLVITLSFLGETRLTLEPK